VRLVHLFESPYDLAPDGKPRAFYRGTQRPEIAGKLPTRAFSDDPDIASIYAAAPHGNEMDGLSASYVDGSSVHRAQLAIQNPLDLSDYGHVMTLADFMGEMQYDKPNGMTEEEATKVVNYLINRERDQDRWFFEPGKTGAGPFRYVYYDEDGDEIGEELYSITRVYTPLEQFKDDWEMTYSTDQLLEVAARLEVDVYTLVDSPRFKVVAQRLGYDGVIHQDEMSGAVVAKDLMGKEVADIRGLRRGQPQSSQSMDSKHVHTTVRPFKDEQIKPYVADHT
jgi:hypothetical protein